MTWPTINAIDNSLRTELNTLATELPKTEDILPLRDVEWEVGGGRVVYDITEYTNTPAVAKVAFNDYGVNEMATETIYRDRTTKDQQTRLAPIQHTHEDYRWGIQPQCDPLPHKEQHEAVEKLTSIFSDEQFDQREIYSANIATYNDRYVLVDYGGVL